MYYSNKALVPEQNKYDELISAPTEWPLLFRGLRMNGPWEDRTPRVYLLGNPFVWWGSFFALVLYLILYAVYYVFSSRGVPLISTGMWERYKFGGKLFLGGWSLHYLPFFVIGRVTYLHHYFPALLFAIGMFAFLFDHFIRVASLNVRRVTSLALMALFSFAFWVFREIPYGMTVPVNAMQHAQWLQSWHIV